MSGASILLLLGVLAHQPETLPLSDVERADPMRLAPAVLAPEIADQVTGGWVRRMWMPGQVHRALFWETPQPHRQGVCARRVHVVELANTDAPGHEAPRDTPLALRSLGDGVQYGPSHPEPATSERCAELTGYVAGPVEETEAQLRMMLRLTEAMRLAEGSGSLPFELACESETADACADPREALSALPLNRMIGLRLRNTQYRVDDTTPGVRIRKMEPVRDGRWPEASVEFDTSGSDGKSWSVTLVGADRLETVRLRRSTIIRH
jgi:hypothetical protein